MCCIGNFLLQIFTHEGFVKACPVGLTDSYIYIYVIIIMTDSSSGRKGVTSNRTGGVLMSNSGKVDTVQRQAHQPNTSNSGKVDTVQRQAHQPNSGKVDTVQRQAHQPNSAQAVKAVETVASGTAQPQVAARGSSEQATEAQDAVRAEWDTSHMMESSWKDLHYGDILLQTVILKSLQCTFLAFSVLLKQNPVKKK